MSDADLVFLPWVRRGAAAALLDPDSFGPDQPGVPTTTASVTINSGRAPQVPVTVMGPGYVTGIDRRQVVRTDPAPGSRTFEPNYFPLIELDEPALPWLFTPAGANSQQRLRPWLALVVVRLQGGVRLDPPTTGPLPVLRIAKPARPAEELPDLNDSWAWAHGQVTSQTGVSIAQQLVGNPERSISRLLCSRVLAPDTEYLACVVPTFELGRKAGLGQEITADDESHLRPAWNLAEDADKTVELPVYHSWSFATGAGGDFRSLAMLLKVRQLPDGIGVQPVDVTGSGLAVDLPPKTMLPLAGALRPLGSSTGGWPSSTLQDRWEQALRPVLDAAAEVPVGGDPLLAPPLYGSAQAGRIRLDEAKPSRWFEQLNLMPTHRAVAHLGTRVVQDHQEALMASAWDQAAELARVNQLLRQTQLGWRVAVSLHTRHIARMDAAVGLQVLAPAQARMLRADPTLKAQLAGTGLEPAAFSTALRRVARPRGSINRRVQRVSSAAMPRTTSVLAKLQPLQMQQMMLSRALPPMSGPITLERAASGLGVDVGWAEATSAAVLGAPRRPAFEFVAMGTPVPMTLPFPEPLLGPVRPMRPIFSLRPVDPNDPGGDPFPDPEPDPDPEPFPLPHPRPVDSPAAVVFRKVASDHLARFRPQRAIPSPPAVLDGQLSVAFAEMVARTAPTETFARRARAVFTIPGEAADDGQALDPVGLSPAFPQPMVRPLVGVAQSLVLPGLDLVLPNTVVPLETNTAFVEAYLVGLNTEMGRELLWRGYPADLGATYFDRFWDASASRPPDIAPIRTWGERSLGAAGTEEDFVLLVRSELLRRYPDAIVYATRPGEDRYPIFTGGLEPDVRYFGFDIPRADVAGWSIVIQEHPSAPRFGIVVGTDTGTAAHVAPPAPNAALIAQQTRQLPVRITLPTSVLGLA